MRLLFFSIILVIISCSQTRVKEKTVTATLTKKSFATINGEIYTINKDTILLKKELKENLLPNTDVTFNKIEIVKQQTLGNEKKDFYYFIARDFKKHIKVAKWLNREGNKLYENNTLEAGELFEQTYLICIGEQDCTPQVFIMDSARQWGCSDDYRCIIDEAKAEEMAKKCKLYKSVYFPD